ncbi:MAG: TorF family putative porin, partial [Burkholderiaceae bacterium]
MKKTLLAVALASSLTSFGAVAADKAPEPDFSISGNFGLFSDYRFRGISQTDRAPALQGGFDLTHKSGFYL